MASDKRWLEQLDYSCALQRAIEYHCRGKEVPPDIAKKCPHHARLLSKCKGAESNKPYGAATEPVHPLMVGITKRIEKLERLLEREYKKED